MFTTQSNHPTTDAQRNLSGLTHYVDPETLRFHRSRILSAYPILGGRLYALRESCSLDWRHTQRGQRWVVFNLDGEIVFRPSLEECGTKAQADRAFAAWKAAAVMPATDDRRAWNQAAAAANEARS